MRITGRRTAALLGGVVAFGVMASAAYAAQPEHEFVGSKKCGMCHRTPKIGNQLQIWQSSAHANAYEVLATPQAKEQAAGLGIDDPKTSGACLKCHSTAYWFSEAAVSEQVPLEEGVSCESCHGPGKDYMSMSVMKDRAAATAAGLIIPDESGCVMCHNEDNPNPKPFDFAAYWEKIKHPIPE